MIHLTSSSNERIRLAARLASDGSERKKRGLFVVEGEKLCAEALRAGYEIDTAFVRADLVGLESLAPVITAAYSAFSVDERLCRTMSDAKTPQGVFCVCRAADETDNGGIPSGGCLLALDRVQNPDNLAACVRTAEAMGFSGVIAAGGCDRYNPKALRASMGSLLRMPVTAAADLASELEKLSNTGFTVYVSVVDGKAERIDGLEKKRPCVVVIGNEGAGVSDEVRSAADVLFTIPMPGVTESLNAAAAAAIIMWEFSKAAPHN
ncbi:MAG: RNA methyltransferase [Clostridia bacterium]|nr:RNA methyltransferase [Clostridia bacterium]